MYYPRQSHKKPDRKAITSLYYHVVSLSSLPSWQAYSILNLYLTYGLSARRAEVYQKGFEQQRVLPTHAVSHQHSLDEPSLELLPLPGIKAGNNLSQ